MSKGIYTSMFPSLATFKNVSFLTARQGSFLAKHRCSPQIMTYWKIKK